MIRILTTIAVIITISAIAALIRCIMFFASAARSDYQLGVEEDANSPIPSRNPAIDLN